MSQRSLAHPPTRRGSMRALPWAGGTLRARAARWLFRRQGPSHRQVGDKRPAMLRRYILLLLVLAGAAVGTRAMSDVLPESGGTFVEVALLVLFSVLFAWISAGFWTGVLGAFALLRGPGRSALSQRLAGQPLLPLDVAARTAIIMPICNEHVPTVYGGLTATIDSLLATGESANFDVYVLSDTSDPNIRAAEQAAWSDLADHVAAANNGLPASIQVHYRWRQRRRQRKAGNVADFCRRWGRSYRYFIVLDADSVMSGECLTTLVRLMEAHPDAGIIQTAPKAVGHETFHARVQQFCARAYGPLFTAGMRFWQLGESHYWGHNAILRVEPFMTYCALAPLKGEGSLSGEVLSHDFVEAALMRRAGWKVWVADELQGSYEQIPPNLLAELQRDRRWCQGNLQNSRLMLEPGLHMVHRTAFLTGVLAYGSSPLWLMFLMLSTLLFAQHAGNDPTYFFEPYQLFPIWPTAHVKLMLTLFGLTGVLLLAPKALSIAAIIVRGQAGRYGGVARLLVSAFIEFLHSMLLAPVRMIFHTQFVLAAMTGWRLDWKSPPRDDAATSWKEAAARHGVHTLLTLVWIGAILAGSATFPWWLSPILAGLLAAIPLSVWGSSVRAGRALRQHGLLMTPEEVQPPDLLLAAKRAEVEVASRQISFMGAVADSFTQSRVVQALPLRQRSAAKAHAETLLLERALVQGLGALSDKDQLRLLSSAKSLASLQKAVEARQAHSSWLGALPMPGAALHPVAVPVA